MVMRRDSFALDQRVASVEELADVTAEVLLEHKLATWVELIIAVQVQHQVIKDEKRDSSCYSFVNLVICKDEHLSVTWLSFDFAIRGGCFNNHIGFGVCPPVEALE